MAADEPSSLIVSVILCTRDRASSLQQTLQSISVAARAVDEPWELLVDNGSVDATPSVVDSFSSSLPIRRIWQPTPGLSNARNAGVAASRGDYIVWTDDDVLVHELWLKCYIAAFRRYPDCALFGGRAVPLFEEPARRAVQAASRDLRSMLAIRDEPSWVDVTLERVPYGLNYAIRGREQRAHTYDPGLGVAPGRRRGGEETALIRSILRDGGKGVWVWDALVYHRIPAARQTARYIYWFYRADGYDFPRVPTKPHAASLRLLLRFSLSTCRQGVALALRWIARQPSWIRALVELARSHGTFDRIRDEKLRIRDSR